MRYHHQIVMYKCIKIYNPLILYGYVIVAATTTQLHDIPYSIITAEKNTTEHNRTQINQYTSNVL